MIRDCPWHGSWIYVVVDRVLDCRGPINWNRMLGMYYIDIRTTVVTRFLLQTYRPVHIPVFQCLCQGDLLIWATGIQIEGCKWHALRDLQVVLAQIVPRV